VEERLSLWVAQTSPSLIVSAQAPMHSENSHNLFRIAILEKKEEGKKSTLWGINNVLTVEVAIQQLPITNYPLPIIHYHRTLYKRNNSPSLRLRIFAPESLIKVSQSCKDSKNTSEPR